VNSTLFFAQDTIAGTNSDSTSSIKKFSTSEVDNIFQAMERKERELDSIARVRAYRAYLRSIEQNEPEGFDTSAVPYNFDQDAFKTGQNPLRNYTESYYSEKDTTKPVFYEPETVSGLNSITEISPLPSSPSGPSHDLRPDWLMGIIIACFILLAWLKLFYNKFLDQTIQSLANYQLSTKLFRDQNIFSRRVAFALNINFILTGSAFIYLILGYFHLRFFQLSDILSYITYAGIIIFLLVLRFLSSHMIGHIFKRHSEFREYLHQLFLIHKNMGIYLLIFVIAIAYIQENLRIYPIYLSGLFVLAAVVIRVGRVIKIVLNNKDILIFYLILYLCTLEILPWLIFYRFFSFSVLTG